MGQIRILTDSTADLSVDVVAALDVTVVPAYIQMQSRSYRDGVELSRERFYTELPAMSPLPTTAAAPLQDFVAAYQRLAAEADQVITLTVASQLSSICDMARLAAREVPELTVHVVDSGQLSMGLGFMVMAAAEAAAAGCGAQEILAMLAEMRKRVVVYAVLDSLEYVHRGGRVGWAQTMMAQLLRIKPIIRVYEGVVSNLARVRTRSKAVMRLEQLVGDWGPLERLAVLHTLAPELQGFVDRMAKLKPLKDIVTTTATTIIGAHVGPGALGVAAVSAK
jgi:DegV family protein with EDD domain